MASLREIFDRLNPLQGGASAQIALDAEAARDRFEARFFLQPEHEVYLADLWDPTTRHSRVLFTGIEEDCELYLETDPRPNCMRFKARIRPTGMLINPQLESV